MKTSYYFWSRFYEINSSMTALSSLQLQFTAIFDYSTCPITCINWHYMQHFWKSFVYKSFSLSGLSYYLLNFEPLLPFSLYIYPSWFCWIDWRRCCIFLCHHDLKVDFPMRTSFFASITVAAQVFIQQHSPISLSFSI